MMILSDSADTELTALLVRLRIKKEKENYQPECIIHFF